MQIFKVRAGTGHCRPSHFPAACRRSRILRLRDSDLFRALQNKRHDKGGERKVEIGLGREEEPTRKGRTERERDI